MKKINNMKKSLIISETLTFELNSFVNIFITKNENRLVGKLISFNEKFAIVKVGKFMYIVKNSSIFPIYPKGF